MAHVEDAGFIDCSEKHHTNFELFATEEGKKVCIYGLGQAVRGIVAMGGMPGLMTEEDARRLTEGMEEELYSDTTMFGMQMKWVWGRKAE
ncbi:hypothetical protein IMZ48_21165 [Candidatus Bathyarchaeota archaeon]|nr:hypothetical protein [Candidatus Bathyarchaeota archaeon]